MVVLKLWRSTLVEQLTVRRKLNVSRTLCKTQRTNLHLSDTAALGCEKAIKMYKFDDNLEYCTHFLFRLIRV